MPTGHLVYAVSDSTGETAEQAARAALAQFGAEARTQVRVAGSIRDEDTLAEIVREAQEEGAMIVYTIVEPSLRARMGMLAKEQQVTALDLLGSLIWELSRHLELSPLYLPGLGHETDAAYFQRMEAVEFAVNNDDGRLPANLAKADVVFVGLSRTSKTPLSNYVAHRGYKAANVPLVKDIPPPPQLEEIDPRRVYALVMDPTVLSAVRRGRVEVLGTGHETEYCDLRHVREEMAWARRYFRDHPEWTVVDITEKAIEETAAVVLETYRRRFESPEALAAEGNA